MKIDLTKEIEDHLKRVKLLAEDAADNESEETYSSRASAMTALSTILKELTKTREQIYNMQRLQHIEQLTIETLKEYLSIDQYESFLGNLRERLSRPNISGN